MPTYPPHSLAPARGALFGAWVEPLNWSAPNAEQSAVASFDRMIGRKLAIDQLYTTWAGPMPLAAARWDLRQGIIPMISWAPAPTAAVTAGVYDRLIRTRARELAALRGPVMLRWFAEMELPQNRTDAGPGSAFIAAWRRMHRIFTTSGATNVRWVWCPDISAFTYKNAVSYYPGNSYTDWVGADGYNWAPELPRAPWMPFARIFKPFYDWGLQTGKPMLIGEYGVLEGTPGAKATWFRQADRAIKQQFPGLRALVYFDSDHPRRGVYFNWRVTSSHSALAAFRLFANDPYFLVKPDI